MQHCNVISVESSYLSLLYNAPIINPKIGLKIISAFFIWPIIKKAVAIISNVIIIIKILVAFLVCLIKYPAAYIQNRYYLFSFLT